MLLEVLRVRAARRPAAKGHAAVGPRGLGPTPELPCVLSLKEIPGVGAVLGSVVHQERRRPISELTHEEVV